MQSYRGQSWPASSGDGAEGGGCWRASREGHASGYTSSEKDGERGLGLLLRKLGPCSIRHRSCQCTSLMDTLHGDPAMWVRSSCLRRGPTCQLLHLLFIVWKRCKCEAHPPPSTSSTCEHTRQGLWTPIIFTQVSWKDACDLVLIINKTVSD